MSQPNQGSFFAPSEFWRIVIVLAILVLGFGTRMYDLTDPPLDYAGARQLRSMMIARGKYYGMIEDAPAWKADIARKQANIHGMIEPEIIESITAATYLVAGGEYVWIARIYSSLFWVLGGLALYSLARKMVSTDGAVIALVYYLFVPFGLLASRTFQPDPLMTAMIITAWLCFYHWYTTSTWKWAVLSGLSAGAAMFIKSTAVFFLLIGMAAVVLNRERMGKLIKNAQVWVLTLLSGIPVLAYHIYGIFIIGELESQLRGRFIPQMWADFGFYVQWLKSVNVVLGHYLIFAIGLVGIFFISKRLDRFFLFGIWVGYMLFGFTVPYHISTHHYYHLPLIPLLALSAGALADWMLDRMRNSSWIIVVQIALFIIVLIGVGGGHFLFHQDDYRHEPGYFEKVAGYVDPEAAIVALSQDYGYRLSYYGWLVIHPWRGSEDFLYAVLRDSEVASFSTRFAEYSDDYDYFIVTRMKELRQQEKLYQELYSHYPIVREGGGYVIFDLQGRKD